ncbi:paraquat-inducible protein A [Sansalvadorimonas sp. 2012CJ34-2]|uniref:Paraquat-inducible protein A n=1 Tax=Parendozoicomonas callyspongiae TaxID=2942213 RepID=A0ABT0PC32_9GAMM|nr:paraquat-inducible protein A [Sansalvadorimonas sp. 2012CJ34-2]MCL6268601.1 paraquat-inducible protein A [Sansalvadorimonas sp. 2012CJ34-2]
MNKPARICSTCHLTSITSNAFCPRCRQKLYVRKPDSLKRTLALLLSATLLYIPANVLPIMIIEKMGQGKSDTIMTGVIALAGSGMVPIAIVVFVASIVVPLFKIIGITLLLLHASGLWHGNTLRLQKLYRFIDWVGRWSMLDIFMISVLISLVQFRILSIYAGQGATAFAAVVVLTMLASHTFDSRLLWDRWQAHE